MGKDKHKATDKEIDQVMESCGKCHRDYNGKDEIQGMRKNGQRQRKRERQRQPRRQRQRERERERIRQRQRQRRKQRPIQVMWEEKSAGERLKTTP
jgi:hypothetical protein